MGETVGNASLMSIPLFGVYMSPTVKESLLQTLYSGYIGQGPVVEEFELGLKESWDLPSVPLATSSCTHALDLAYHLCGIAEGSEVISTPMTCSATNIPLVNRGAKIVWADVCPITGLISPEDVKSKITKETKAIVAVDWAGRPCDYKRLKSFGVPVIQDAAHRLGGSSQHGDYVCWSFQAIKFLTTGDGGALLVPGEQRDRAELLRWYGLDRKSSAQFRCEQNITEAGYKYHMNDIAATIGLENLSGAHENCCRNMANARMYSEAFIDSKIATPPMDANCSFWIYSIITGRREELQSYLKDVGIDSGSVHRRCDKHDVMIGDLRLKGVDYFDANQLCIPVGWWLSDSDLEYIVRSVRSFFGHRY